MIDLFDGKRNKNQKPRRKKRRKGEIESAEYKSNHREWNSKKRRKSKMKRTNFVEEILENNKMPIIVKPIQVNIFRYFQLFLLFFLAAHHQMEVSWQIKCTRLNGSSSLGAKLCERKIYYTRKRRDGENAARNKINEKNGKSLLSFIRRWVFGFFARILKVRVTTVRKGREKNKKIEIRT